MFNKFSKEYINSIFSGSELNRQLEGWLNAADLTHGPARAIIAPLVTNYFFVY